MTRTFHRFRSTFALLDGYHELENQQIYFASPDELNDPMEGFRDIYWHGDEIAWKSLLKHYLLCLEHACSLFVVGGNDISIRAGDIPVFKTEDDLPTAEYKDQFREIHSRFFGNDLIGRFIKGLSTRRNPVRRSELLTYISNLHLFALETVFAVYERRHLIHNRPDTDFTVQMSKKTLSHLPDIVRLVNEIELKHSDVERGIDTFLSAGVRLNSQLRFIIRYNGLPPDNHNKPFVLLDFPEVYIQEIERIVYPDWYTACFMSQYRNSSVWGHYGDRHKGVCLSFKATMTESNHPFIRLNGINGWGSSGPIYGERNHAFYKIDYNEKHIEIDFFRSIGCLPRPTLIKYWYTGENGSRSACAANILESEEEWRVRYWANFYPGITRKLRDWEYEEEYRLILTSSLVDLNDPARRMLNYEFNDLESITFGIKTSTEDKLKIVKIIESKCRKENRKEFEFYQAHYHWPSGTIERSKMDLLRFA